MCEHNQLTWSPCDYCKHQFHENAANINQALGAQGYIQDTVETRLTRLETMLDRLMIHLGAR